MLQGRERGSAGKKGRYTFHVFSSEGREVGEVRATVGDSARKNVAGFISHVSISRSGAQHMVGPEVAEGTAPPPTPQDTGLEHWLTQ